MEDNYILQTFDLTKKYQGRTVVDKVNMHIKQGDIYGFVGENGAGKTTIMRMITGLTLPNGGSFTLFGCDNNSKEINKAKQNVSAIVEAVSFTKNMSAIDNLKMQCMITDIKKSDAELWELLAKVGLEENQIKGKKVGNFSLGMRQRLGIAMAMINNPKFVLLDEPMNGLDPQGFIEIRETIKRLNDEGVTFLISSHLLSELEKTVTCVGFISHGKMLEELTIEELHQKARKKLVIGLKNELDMSQTIKLLNINEYAVKNNDLIIYDELDINDCLNKLVQNKIEINKINMLEDTIENYYINLITRGDL